jgi:excisionase family DNA binding protein
MNEQAPILTRDVAQLLQVSEATVRLWADAGRLQVVRTARGVRLFDREQVEQLAREREQRQRQAAVDAVGAVA